MALNALAREENVKRSIKKYFVDLLGNDIVMFDKSLSHPDVRTDKTRVKWVIFQFGPYSRSVMSDYTLTISCMTRKDPEGVELSKLCDQVMDLLVDRAISDGMARIPLYDTSIVPWIKIGGMTVQETLDSLPFEAPGDETKARIMAARLRWGAAL